MIELPWLSWIIFFPLVGAALLVLMPREAGRLIRTWAATVALAEVAFSLPLWWRLVPAHPGWQFAEQYANDGLAKMKESYVAEGGTRSNTRYGWLRTDA